MGEHRVPMLGSAWRRNEDPASSRDPRVRAVVGALATLPAPEMRAEFRAELRAQLVAIAPRIVAEANQPGQLAEQPHATASRAAGAAVRSRPTPRGRATAGPARHSDSFLDRLRRIHVGRPLGVATAVVVAFALLLGGAVVMSRKSLPGDALYGLKRASERLELATAGSDTEKAKDYLNFAATRAQEVKDLLGRTTGSALGGVHAAGLGAGTAKLIGSTLDSADEDVKAASRLLGTNAVRHTSPTPLATMTAWAPKQAQRLGAIAAAMPDPALRARALDSQRLVQAAAARATALESKLGCGCLGSAGQDALGPKPCTTCTTKDAGDPTSSPGAPATSRSAQRPRNSHTAGGGAPGLPGGAASSTANPGAPAPGGASGSPSKTPPIINVPSLLPSGTPSLPVAASSCGLTVSLPIIGGVGVGVCSGVNVHVGG